MRKIKLNATTEITTEVVKYILEQHKSEATRVKLLQKYYNNENDIMNRSYKDKNKPQNKLSNGYASYITNTATGYFMGKAIAYKNIEKYEPINLAFIYNDEADVNTTLAKNASICGYGIEMMYSDENANVRFTSVDPSECAIVYDNSLQENILLAVRYYDEKVIGEDEIITHIEVYSKDKVSYYKKDGDDVVADSFTEVNSETGSTTSYSEKEHFFKDVPVTIYANNDELFGDFEKVKSLIDAYDKSQSDSANDFEMFTHAMLVINGYLASNDDKSSINDKHIIEFQDSQGDAKYLIKNIQDAALENYKNRLDNDIHKFSFTPNLSDDSFANSSSGISLTYKLMGLENVTGVKESKFKKGLMRRIELMCNFLNILTNDEMTYTEIEPVFTRNRPSNDVEEADTMQKLTGILSEETVISLCSKVSNVQAELERKREEEKESFGNEYSDLDNKDEKVVE